ncbi:MAG: HU family DNA-binding protein [Planctomycetota bacterium]
MNTITKKILVDRIASENGMQRTQVKKVLQDFLDQIVDELGEGNRIEFRDFGVFEVKHRAARTAQNPKTLERVPVAAKRSVRFKPGRRMRIEMDRLPPETAGARPDAPDALVEPKGRSANENDESPVIGSIGAVGQPESIGAR